MGCGSCGTGSGDGKPSGCQSNGGCSTGGCNRLNVYNWLSDIPFADLGKPYPIIEISFNNGSRKDFYRNNTNHIFEKGAWVAVEGAGGFDVGQISLMGELVKLQLKKYGVAESAEMKRVLRPAGERDMEIYNAAKIRERDTLIRARAIARELSLEMKIAEAEYQADAKKVTFFYTADSRVDFRELIKVYASDFRAKVEMRQIGARQESGKVGGIGSCGRELCCSTWLTDFKTVNTTAARYQNLSINQTKLSGQCGRLKCCLNYELDTYMDALHSFPEGAEQIEVSTGRAYLQKKDIFRNLMWYSFGGSNKQYPLTIDRVLEIQALNADGKKPDDLEAIELQVKHKDPEKTVDMGFVNDVGQLTLSSLSKSGKKKQQTQQGKQRQQPKPQGKPQQNKPPVATAAEGEKPAPQAGNKPQGNRPPRPPRQQAQGQQVQQPGEKPQQGDKQQQKPQQQARPQQGEKPQAKPQQARPPRQPRPSQQPGQSDQQPQQQQNKPQQPGDGDGNGNKEGGNQLNKGDRPQQQQRRKFNRPPQDRKDPGGAPQKEQ